MKAYVEILSTPAADTPGTALLVHFDDKRYIFGQLGEGVQRALSERQARLGKVTEMFISGRTDWATTGGLVGFILTIGDQNAHKDSAPGVAVYGGDNLLHSVASTRSFVLRTALRLKVSEMVEGAEEWRDGNVVVRTMHVRPDADEVVGVLARKRSRDEWAGRSREERMEFLQRKVEGMFWSAQRSINTQGPADDNGPADILEKYIFGSEDEGEAPEKKRRSRDGDATATPPVHSNRLPLSHPSSTALSYILMMHDHRGKFLPQIAIQLGVPKGRDFRTLADGIPVTTPSGRVVHPHEVMEPTKTGTGVAICDIPSAAYIESFIGQKEWADTEEIRKRLGCFFWILGPGVIEDQRLLDFIARFPESGHVIADPDVCPNNLKFQGAAKFFSRLNYVDPDLFPPLIASDEPVKPTPPGTVAAKQGLAWNMEPTRGFEEVRCVEPFNPKEAIESLGESFTTIGTEIRESLAATPPQPDSFPGSNVEVYTLGTGSALPSRYRNVSATLLVIPHSGSILLDCGENTLGQLRRLFTPAELNERLRDLKVLYISHLHADHHLGAISVLKARAALLPPDQKTFIVAPYRFLTWLNEYSSVEDFGRSRLVYVPCEELRADSTGTPQYVTRLLACINATAWRTEYAHHCQSSFTTAITFASGFKAAYSGDTRPTRAFVRIGMDATLLVHEATFDDELAPEALAKKHSTISEAVKAGRDMRARVTCLTHFSQRYPKKPDIAVGGDGVIYAFDLMRFKVGEAGERWRRIARGVEEVYRDVEEEEEGEDGEMEPLVAEMDARAEAAEKGRGKTQAAGKGKVLEKVERKKKRREELEKDRGVKPVAKEI